MSDFYGHSGATQISNQLGQQSLDMNERRIGNWEDKTIAYRQLNAQDQAKQSTDVKNSAEADLVAVPKIFKTAQTIGKAGQAAYVGISRGIAQGQSNLALAQRGARASGAVLSEAGMGSKIFGEGAVALKDITGVEGIVGRTLADAGGGEAFAKIAGKGVGEIGAATDVIGDITDLVQTGNLFNSKNADGSVQKATLGEDVGNVATILGGVLDVAAAFTGGALAPVAAAVNIAAATESTAAKFSADQAQKSKDSKGMPSSTPPPTVAPPAFAQFGLLSNQSHNPLAHIG
mgnify:CR=1 FL=1